MSISPNTVLVVEDEKPLRDVYSIVLQKAGYTVVSAANGQEAIDQLDTSKPDFVLLDIFMPVMDGLEFMRAIDLNKHPKTKIVVFSNNSDSGVRDEVCRLGARDVVLKSDLSPSGLVDLVRTQLDGPATTPCD